MSPEMTARHARLRESTPAGPALRAVIILVLFLSTCLATFLALAFRNGGARLKKACSLLGCVGGGVFLAVCLLDLLPDTVETYEKAKMENAFPLPEFFIAVGFLMVLLLEQIILMCHESGGGNHGGMHLLHDDEDPLHPRDDSASGGVPRTDPSEVSPLRAFLLVFAVSLHALFEGVALGVIDDMSVLLQLFGGLIVHKAIVGFCIGMRLCAARVSNITFFFCAVIFSAQVLFGGFGGISLMNWLASGSSERAALIASIMQATACGTFLYITTFEIIPKELINPEMRVLKLLSLLVGFGIVILFIVLFPEAP